MFATLETWRYPAVRNYAQALEAWERAPKSRTAPKRWIVAGQRDKWISLKEDGSVSFVRDDSDMVSWHPPVRGEERVTVTPCSLTRGYTAFANAFLPSDLKVEWSAVGAPYATATFGWGADDARHCRVMETTCFLHERGSWRPLGKLVPFDYPKLDKRAARAALEASPYADFMDWARARVHLGWHPRDRGLQLMHPKLAKGQFILGVLRAPERWEELLYLSPSPSWSPAHVIDEVSAAIRQAVYTESGAVKIEKHDYLDGYSSIYKWLRACREYRGAMLR